MYYLHILLLSATAYLCLLQYLLDGDYEYYDPAESSTTLCPFLPGQVVNILDVPMQPIEEETYVCRESVSSLGSTIYTMDPEAKYLSPKPSVRQKPRDLSAPASVESLPSSVAKYPPMATARSLPARTFAASSIAHRLNMSSAESLSKGGGASLSISKHIPLVTALQRIRGTKSAGDCDQQEFRVGSEAMSMTKSADLYVGKTPGLERASVPVETLKAKSVVSERSPLRHAVSARSAETDGYPRTNLVNQADPSTTQAQDDSPTINPYIPLDYITNTNIGGIPSAVDREWPPSPGSTYYTPLQQLREYNSFFAETAPGWWNQTLSQAAMDGPNSVSDQALIHPLLRDQQDSPGAVSVPDDAAMESHDNILFSSETSFFEDGSDYDPPSQERSVSSSDNVYEIFSVGLGASTVQTEAMSPCHLSQPLSPLKSDFGDNILDPRDDYNSDRLSSTLKDLEKLHISKDAAEASVVSAHPPLGSSGGFKGYKLSEEEQSSALTLRNLPSTTYKSPNGDSPYSQQGSKDLVHSWNDGSEHRINMTSFDELVEDLGYLGEMII